MDISWGGVEKTKGKYDFSQHDKLIEDLDKLGIRLLFIIDYGNPNYDNGLAPHTPEGREAYAKFCAALAERYSGKDIIWELWNEPNIDKFWLPAVNIDDYMAFCKSVVPAIRDKDQNACIIAPATSAFDMKFMESLISFPDFIASIRLIESFFLEIARFFNAGKALLRS